MENVISEYQRWKQQGETLRLQAKQAMESRFRELLAEAARISQEYQKDFGSALKPAPPVTAFRFRPTGVKTTKKASVAKEAAKPVPAKASADPKIAALQKKLSQIQTKLDTAKQAGKPTKHLEDRAYEVEDEIRLATEAS